MEIVALLMNEQLLFTYTFTTCFRQIILSVPQYLCKVDTSEVESQEWL